MDQTMQAPEPAVRARRPGETGPEVKALTSLLKAIKSIGLYPEGSPVPEKIAGAFASDLAQCFDACDEVQITFRSSGVQLNGTPVTAGADDSWDLPLALFEVGLRDLTFLKDVTPKELHALVRLLSRAARRELDPTEEDLSVCLWEMDLPGISYRIADLGDEAESAAAFESAESAEEDAEIREIWDSLHPIERYAGGGPLTGESDPDDAAVAVGEEEIELLRHEAKREPAGMGRKFILVLLELVLHDLPMPEFDRVKTVLPEFFIRLLAQGQFRSYLRLAGRLLERVEHLAGDAERSLDPLGPQILGAPAAQAALSALRSGHCDDPQAAWLILSSVDSHGLLPILDEALEGGRGPGRAELKAIPQRVVTHVLAERPGDLFAHPDRMTAEQMRYLATLAAPDPQEAQQWDARMAPFVASPDPDIRLRALEMLCAVRPATLEERLLAVLGDSDSRLRLLAVARLSELFGEQAFPRLRAVVAAEDFAAKDLDERATFYEALTRAAPTQAFPILEQIVRRRDWLAPKAWHEEKVCALRGLGEAPYEQAMPLLMRYRKSRDPLLAEACREALARQHRRAREEAAAGHTDPGTADEENAAATPAA